MKKIKEQNQNKVWKIYGLTSSSVQKDLIIFIQVPNIPVNSLITYGSQKLHIVLFYCRTTMATACYNGISQFVNEFWWLFTGFFVILYTNHCKSYFEKWIYSTGWMVGISTMHSLHASASFLFWIKRLKAM